MLFVNINGQVESFFLGAPDDICRGVGGRVAPHDFGMARVANLAGADSAVYEADGGGVVFSLIQVSVSLDGSTFTDAASSQTSCVAIVGDELHGNPSFAKSFDLGAMAPARCIRIDGKGTRAAGGTNAFDLDAIGAINLVSAVPLPAGMPLLLGALAVLTGLRRRSRA